jgi:hypothetical protein
LTATGPDRVRELLEEGRRLLERGRSREAADVFGRILLRDSAHREARAALETARASAAEEQRLLEARIEEDREAAAPRRPERAREPAPGSVAPTSPARATARRDRLSDGPGMGLAAVELRRRAASGPPRSGWSRRAAVAAWAATFSVLGAAVGSSWDRLVSSLVRNPTPRTAAAPLPTLVLPPSSGERAVAEARRLIERGDLPGALAVLDAISPEEPEYPFARQLGAQVESALRERGRGR